MDVQRWTEPEAIYALGSGVGRGHRLAARLRDHHRLGDLPVRHRGGLAVPPRPDRHHRRDRDVRGARPRHAAGPDQAHHPERPGHDGRLHRHAGCGLGGAADLPRGHRAQPSRPLPGPLRATDRAVRRGHCQHRLHHGDPQVRAGVGPVPRDPPAGRGAVRDQGLRGCGLDDGPLPGGRHARHAGAPSPAGCGDHDPQRIGPGPAHLLHGGLPRHPDVDRGQRRSDSGSCRGSDQGPDRGRSRRLRRLDRGRRGIGDLPRRSRAGAHRRHVLRPLRLVRGPGRAAPGPASRPWRTSCSAFSSPPPAP